MRTTLSWALLCILAETAFAQELNITFLHTPPKVATRGVELVIKGNIVGADQVSIAALNFRTQGESEFQVRELALMGGEQYRGTIPGEFVSPPALEYFCYAVDFDGNRTAIFASEESPHRVEVLVPETSGGNRADEPDPQPDPDPGGDTAPDSGSRVLTPSTVVQAPQIEAMGATTLAEVLDALPGVSTSRTVSGYLRPAVRGVQADGAVLILLDDHRINDLYTGRALLEFPAEAIQRVEVVCGPASLRHGPGALAGVIRVFTRKDENLRAQMGYGRFNTLRLSGQGGYRAERFGLSGQVQFANSDGHERRVEADALTGVQGDEPVSNAPGPVDDRLSQLHARLRGDLSGLGGGELALLAGYLFQSRGALVGKFDTLDRGSDLSVHQLNLDLTYRLPLGAWLRLDSRALFDMQAIRDTFQVIPDDNQPYRAGDLLLDEGLSETTRYRGMTLGAEVLARALLPANHKLIGGLQFEYLTLSDLTIERDSGSVACPPNGFLQVRGHLLPCDRQEGEAAGKSRMRFSFFAEDRWSDLLEGLDLRAGLRLDHLSDVGLLFNPRGELGYRPLEGLRFSVSYDQAFRAPTLQELYQQPEFDPLAGGSGNPDLDAVRAHSLELTVEGELKTRPMVYRLRGAFFYGWIREGITPAGAPETGARLENRESLEILGVQGELSGRFGKRGRLFFNGSWFRARVSTSGEADESFISEVPQVRFNLGLDLPLTGWLDVHLGIQYGSERRNNVRRQLEFFRPFRIPAYTLVRAGLSTGPVLFDHLVLFVNLTNLFDHDLRDPAPRPDRLPGLVPRAPFSFMAGIGWRS